MTKFIEHYSHNAKWLEHLHARKEYQEIKQCAARESKNLSDYKNAKTDFIKKILRKAGDNE